MIRYLPRSICTLICLWAAQLTMAQNSFAPDWVMEGMQHRVGTWIADNAAYQSENEPAEAYRLDWEWGLGEKTLVGRLTAITDGRVSEPIWEFREVWNPGTGELLLQQYGADGTYGEGTLVQLEDGRIENVQPLWFPDGTTALTGHRESRTQDAIDSQAYRIDTDGTWMEDRFYRWVRAGS